MAGDEIPIVNVSSASLFFIAVSCSLTRAWSSLLFVIPILSTLGNFLLCQVQKRVSLALTPGVIGGAGADRVFRTLLSAEARNICVEIV